MKSWFSGYSDLSITVIAADVLSHTVIVKKTNTGIGTASWNSEEKAL